MQRLGRFPPRPGREAVPDANLQDPSQAHLKVVSWARVDTSPLFSAWPYAVERWPNLQEAVLKDQGDVSTVPWCCGPGAESSLPGPKLYAHYAPGVDSVPEQAGMATFALEMATEAGELESIDPSLLTNEPEPPCLAMQDYGFEDALPFANLGLDADDLMDVDNVQGNDEPWTFMTCKTPQWEEGDERSLMDILKDVDAADTAEFQVPLHGSTTEVNEDEPPDSPLTDIPSTPNLEDEEPVFPEIIVNGSVIEEDEDDVPDSPLTDIASTPDLDLEAEDPALPETNVKRDPVKQVSCPKRSPRNRNRKRNRNGNRNKQSQGKRRAAASIEWPVEAIVDHRPRNATRPTAVRHYKVRWTGSWNAREKETWEPRTHIAVKLVDEYWSTKDD
ncbi:hypothetical protein F4780DRAFT_753314 [Xylariomycetidae sp. FL0641]|nr:hypothetical protein F4780DRAFT_753314 [Xylariomycetidae sp. FL0641]